MGEYFDETYEDSFLEHHGILGQKWGVRRFQNYDGTLKAAGKRRAKTDRDRERAKKKEIKAKAKEAKDQAKAEKAREDLEKAKAKAVANADLNEIMKLRGSMTTQELREAATRALAIGQVNNQMPKEKSRIDKLTDALKTGKNVADSIKGMHESLSSLRKEFGLDAKSIFKDSDDDDSGKSNQNYDSDIIDRALNLAGKITKDTASKANEKYQEHKFQKDLNEARDRKKDSDTLSWLESLNGGKKEPSLPKANFDSGFKLKDGDYSVFSSTPVSAAKASSSTGSKTISRILKNPSTSNVSVEDLTAELLKKNKGSLGL